MARIIRAQSKRAGVFVVRDRDSPVTRTYVGDMPHCDDPDCLKEYADHRACLDAEPELMDKAIHADVQSRHNIDHPESRHQARIYQIKADQATRYLAGDTTNVALLEREAQVRGISVHELAIAINDQLPDDEKLIEQELARITSQTHVRTFQPDKA